MNNPRLLVRLRAEHADLVAGGWSDVWLVLEGNWGDQVYLTVPWKLLNDDPQALPLLKDLDREAWPSNNGEGRQAYLYSQSEGGSRLRGAKLRDGLWLHRGFHAGWHEEAWKKLLQKKTT
jgi:hypothetical protein